MGMCALKNMGLGWVLLLMAKKRIFPFSSTVSVFLPPNIRSDLNSISLFLLFIYLFDNAIIIIIIILLWDPTSVRGETNHSFVRAWKFLRNKCVLKALRWKLERESPNKIIFVNGGVERYSIKARHRTVCRQRLERETNHFL